MQLSISNTGLVEPVKHLLEDTKSSLSTAKSTAINAPYDFQYASYVNNLDNIINQYMNEVDYISNAINRAEDKYEGAWIEGKQRSESLKEVEIKERRGLKL